MTSTDFFFSFAEQICTTAPVWHRAANNSSHTTDSGPGPGLTSLPADFGLVPEGM